MNCHQCGYPMKEEARFCANCGAPQVNERPALCSGCGAELKPGARFCSGCGTPVTASEPTPTPTEPVIEIPPQPVEPAYPPVSVTASAPQAAEPVTEPPAPPAGYEPVAPPEPVPAPAAVNAEPADPYGFATSLAFDPASIPPPPEIPAVRFDDPGVVAEKAPELSGAPEPPAPLEPPAPQPVHPAYGPLPVEPGVPVSSPTAPPQPGMPLQGPGPGGYAQEPRPMGPPPFQVGQGEPIPPRPMVPSPIPEDKPIKGNSAGVLIAVIAIVLVLAGVAACIIFDLFGLRTMLGGLLPASSIKEESSEASEQVSEPSVPSIGSGRSRPETARPEVSAESSPADLAGNDDYRVSYIAQHKYDDVYPFTDFGVARVQAGDYWGLIDKDGNELAKPIYDEMWGFFEGYSLIVRDGYYGLIDTKGFEVIEPMWIDAYDFSEGLLPVQREADQKWGFIDLNGDTILPFIYDFAYGFDEGYCLVSQNGKLFFIDQAGKQVSAEYDDAERFVEGFAMVMKGTLWGFVDTSFRQIVPCEYDWVSDYHEHGAIVRRSDGQYCLLDESGNVASPVVDDIWNVTNGYAVALQGEYYGLIDFATGEYVIPPSYYDMNFYGDEFLPVTDNGWEWYYIDLKENPHWGVKTFDDALPFYDGLGRVKKNGLWALIDAKGNLVTDYEYDEIHPYINGTAAVCKAGKWGFLAISPK